VSDINKVLLTGANGYIGRHILLELLNQGYQVRASVRSLDKAEPVIAALKPFVKDVNLLSSNLEFIELALDKDAGWSKAMDGIEVLLHTASPFPLVIPADENKLIRPAVDGTIRALKAAKESGIKRVILTSSNAAIFARDLPAGATHFDETMWTDINHPIGRAAYRRSKTLAELAAWDFVKNQAPEIALTVINPTLVIGKPLDTEFGSSMALIDQLVKSTKRMLPDLKLGIVDVRDVAKMHVDAIKIPETRGERILSTSETLSFVQIAKIIKANNPNLRVVTRRAPTFMLRFLAFFNKKQRPGLLLVGRPNLISNEKARELFKMNFISAEKTVIETAEFLIAKMHKESKTR
jgi:dihydroflavonol-4-reductase